MASWRYACFALVLPAALGCSLGAGDIPPPAASAGVAPAAPRARGAGAAVVEQPSAPLQGGRRDEGDDEAPTPPAQPPEDIDL